MDKKITFGKLEIHLYKSLYKGFEMSIAKCGYFDGRPEIHFQLIWFTLLIKLPWINKNWTDECDPPKYGIAIHDSVFWIHLGGKGNGKGGNKWWTWEIPWFTYNFYKQYILGKDGNWINITDKRHDYNWYREHIGYMDWTDRELPDEKSIAQTYYGVWNDKYDDTDINAKYRVELRQWRRKWFMWTDKFTYERKSIDVCFEKEVGSQKGTWKGGVLGAGYDFKDDKETPQECFQRMHREKNW